MGVSRARKHGLYLGGRPWPRACPRCKHCQGGPPDHYYNSRGLCNICHKNIREGGGKGALEEYEQLPLEADDRSLARLYANPGKWLLNYLGGPYSQPFIEQGGSAVLNEALRIFSVIVYRWYGGSLTEEEVSRLVQATRPPHAGPSLPEATLDAMINVTLRVPGVIPLPRLFVSDVDLAVIWVSPTVPVSVTAYGVPGSDPDTILLLEEPDVHHAFPFEIGRLEHVLRCFGYP